MLEEWERIKKENFNTFVNVHPDHVRHLKHFEKLLTVWSKLKITKIDYKENFAGRWSFDEGGVLTIFGSPFDIVIRNKEGDYSVQYSNIWVAELLNQLVKKIKGRRI